MAWGWIALLIKAKSWFSRGTAHRGRHQRGKNDLWYPPPPPSASLRFFQVDHSLKAVKRVLEVEQNEEIAEDAYKQASKHRLICWNFCTNSKNETWELTQFKTVPQKLSHFTKQFCKAVANEGPGTGTKHSVTCQMSADTAAIMPPHRQYNKESHNSSNFPSPVHSSCKCCHLASLGGRGYSLCYSAQMR